MVISLIIIHQTFIGLSVNEFAEKEIQKMDARLAEDLVRRWQNVKSQALGPSHSLEKLPEVSRILPNFVF